MDTGRYPSPAIAHLTHRPNLERIELRHLEQVLAICEAGSLSGAARRLQLSQPALSKSLLRVEEQLGVRLFQRTGGAAKPTDLGRLIAERARELLASSDALRREVEQRAGGATKRLRIAVGPATRLKPLPQVVKGVLADYPQVKLEVTLDDGLAIMRGVDEGRYDIAFGYSENAEPYGELMRANIFEDDTIVVARPGHPALTAPSPLSASELLQHPMASVGVTASFGAWIDGCSPQEIANANAFISNDFDLLIRCLPPTYTMRGARFVFERALAGGELAQVSLTWRSIYQCWMLCAADTWRLPLVKAVAEMAREGAVRAARKSDAD